MNSSHDDVTRRSLLKAAAALPIAASLPMAAAGTATAAAPGASPPSSAAGRRHDVDSPRFTVAVLPDTQYLIDEGGSDSEPVKAAFRHVNLDREDAGVVFLAHLGDVTEHGTSGEMAVADRVFDVVGTQLSYSVLAGNHDVAGGDDQRGPSPFLDTFGPHRYRRSRSFGGASPDGYNTFHTFAAGGREWLVLALDWRVSDVGITWAQSVLDEHPTFATILTTHDLVHADNAGSAQLSGHGEHLWENLIRGNDQIFLALGGHYWPSGRTTLTNDAGNNVHLHIANYQDSYYGGAGMVRYYSFDLARDVIDVETFSPWLMSRERPTLLEAEHRELTDDVNRFSVALPFDDRFAGFAPPVLPGPRPPADVIVPGTVAYWRFDADGLPSAGIRAGTEDAPVTDGTVAVDLSGNGNDLAAQRLHDSGPGALTWTTEHHDTQPAHASLRFDGGKSPDRGAVLRTGPNAPLNGTTFSSGYTIETFVKLPDPFDGDHAWMGILSWEGQARDAGKSSGWSDEEPTCSLNVSPERFLQYVVYPVPIDADPTSWSHAIPVGRWTHIALVNDGRRTIMYVDGSRIVRNAAEESTGISTLGKPFAIGGTQFAEAYGQGFYGWIGDTRIVERALEPDEFLTAVTVP